MMLLAPANDALAQATFKRIHSFCNKDGCPDGLYPNGLLRDSSGNLYGTTQNGGKYNDGLVFKLVPNADKSKYTEHILHNFCKKAQCTDGAIPFGDLIMDVNGSLHGTTGYGGKTGHGVIFKMTPVTNGWTYTVLHSFCHDDQCQDGAGPRAGLSYAGQATGALWDGHSPLFGTTNENNIYHDDVAYELSFNPTTFTVIHTFKTSGYPGPLLVDSNKNIFGETGFGGAYGGGTLYKLVPQGDGTWKTIILHNFCVEQNCADGGGQTGNPGKLIMDASGTLYGTTSGGGTGANCQEIDGCGVVFKRPLGGGYTVLYNFCSLANCADGEVPDAGPIMDGAGSLYGTTSEFNGPNHGVVFKLSAAGTYTVIYSFCSTGTCTDGNNPETPLVLDPTGTLFGTTREGGDNIYYGTVFELIP